MDIPYFEDYMPNAIRAHLLSKPIPDHLPVQRVAFSQTEKDENIPTIAQKLETEECLQFMHDLYFACRDQLNQVLQQRNTDRAFIDRLTAQCSQLNRARGCTQVKDPLFVDAMGATDDRGRVVVGPLGKDKRAAFQPRGKSVTLPSYLEGPHVTLFGPPEAARMCVNAMNSVHRKLSEEPKIVAQLVSRASALRPMWGADDEDSRTPLRSGLLKAQYNLCACADRSLKAKEMAITADRPALPIKRIPGLALPSMTHFIQESPVPLHLYTFAMHMYHCGRVLANPRLDAASRRSAMEAITFYIPKLENEEEAGYMAHLISQAEKLLGMPPGLVRVLVVLENPRAIFRLNEMIDALHPYFAGASLGWHDYLASTARLLQNDPYYRIPVKSNPNIVVESIKEAHLLLAGVVGGRGGIKIGGMYGVLPDTKKWREPSFQVVLVGYIRDVVTQLRRGLDGFWVAHPDFVRVGVALVQAFQEHQKGRSSLRDLVNALILNPKHQQSLHAFLNNPDMVRGLDRTDSGYARALLAADAPAGDEAPNHDEEEVRYNVFQTLQYLAAWLAGSGCVALPAFVGGVRVRIMDDLATTERSRWEIWHEVAHRRVAKSTFLRILHEEMLFIRRAERTAEKQVRVAWDALTSKWYPVAAEILKNLVIPPAGPTGSDKPAEFCTELLLTFTVDQVRQASNPWLAAQALEPSRFTQTRYVQVFDAAFTACACERFAHRLASVAVPDDVALIQHLLRNTLTEDEVVAAAHFHGTLGERADQARHVDGGAAAREQAMVRQGKEQDRNTLRSLGEAYQRRHGFKFLAFASGQSASQLAQLVRTRISNTTAEELQQAREALCAIALKRLSEMGWVKQEGKAASARLGLREEMQKVLDRFGVAGVSTAIFSGANVKDSTGFGGHTQTVCVGLSQVERQEKVKASSWFQVASISKTIATAFAMEVLRERGLGLDSSVNALLSDPRVCLSPSPFRLRSAPGVPKRFADAVTVRHLVEHSAELGMHYVSGVPQSRPGGMPAVEELLMGIHEAELGYEAVRVHGEPGIRFAYSGAAFMVLQLLMLSLTGASSVESMTRSFLNRAGMQEFSFEVEKYAGAQVAPQFAFGYADLFPQGSASEVAATVAAQARQPQFKPAQEAARGAADEIAEPPNPAMGRVSTRAETTATGQVKERNGSKSSRFAAADEGWRPAAPDHKAGMIFPAFAAGSWATPRAVVSFLKHLCRAYAEEEGSGPISHETAVMMLGSADGRLRDTSAFMCPGSAMGGGVFVTKAGGNRFGMHQAANEGFRALYCVCFRGPNAGSGFLVVSNGSDAGVRVNAHVSRLILRQLNWRGVDLNRVKQLKDMASADIPPEQVVNLVYKRLLFDAFARDRAEVLKPQKRDPLADVNLMVGARLIRATDDQFARAENLALPSCPVFDPRAFGRHGKIMDSWESQRHCSLANGDEAEFELKTPASRGIAYVSVSTEFHDGNHARGVRILGASNDAMPAGGLGLKWFELVPLSRLAGHSIHRYRVNDKVAHHRVTHVRIYNVPDGGISRVALFAPGTLPAAEEGKFLKKDAHRGERAPQSIPSVAAVVPRVYAYPSKAQIVRNWRHLHANAEFNLVSGEYGARVVAVSNQHYGPATAVVSPYQPLGMFDGFETARSRARDSAHWLRIALPKSACVHRVVIDFEHFVCNNPRHLWIEAERAEKGSQPFALIPRQFVKPYAGTFMVYEVPSHLASIRIAYITVFCEPCGGFNRIQVLTRAIPSLLTAPFLSSSTSKL